MKENRLIGAGLLCLAALIQFSSCRKQSSFVPVSPAVPQTESIISDLPDPAAFSFPVVLGTPSFIELDRISPPSLFPRAIKAGPFGVSAFFGAEAVEHPLFGDASDGLRFDASDWALARRGDLSYRILDGRLLVASEPERERELWRYESASSFVAGPIAFDDCVIAATDLPSIIAVDRKTGAFVYEREIGTLLCGPLFFLSGSSRLVAFGVDGTLAVYDVSGKEMTEAEDPVEAVLRPRPEAFILIEKRIQDRLGKRDEKPFILFQPYGPRDHIPPTGAVLFRVDMPKAQLSRVYVDGAASRPFLIEIFSDAGEMLVSNLDYVGVEAVLEYAFEEDQTYFAAVALLKPEETEESPALPRSAPRLVIAPK